MTRAQQSVLTCDRCGLQVTGAVGTRKLPDGWVRMDTLVPVHLENATPPYRLATVDLCPACVGEALRWWESGAVPQLGAGR